MSVDSGAKREITQHQGFIFNFFNGSFLASPDIWRILEIFCTFFSNTSASRFVSNHEIPCKHKIAMSTKPILAAGTWRYSGELDRPRMRFQAGTI